MSTKFLEVTSAALVDKDLIPLEEARRWIVKAYRMELAPAVLNDLLKEPTVTLPMCVITAAVQALLRLSPSDRIRRGARTLYRRVPWISPDTVQGTQVRARPVPHAAAAFAPVRDFLRRPAAVPTS